MTDEARAITEAGRQCAQLGGQYTENPFIYASGEHDWKYLSWLRGFQAGRVPDPVCPNCKGTGRFVAQSGGLYDATSVRDFCNSVPKRVPESPIGLNVELDGRRARWRFADVDVELDFGVRVAQFLVDEASGRVAFLCGESQDQQMFLGRPLSFFISVHDARGTALARFVEPKDVSFNYLSANRSYTLAVMATAYMSGWMDWWYGLNVDTGELESLGEGR